MKSKRSLAALSIVFVVFCAAAVAVPAQRSRSKPAPSPTPKAVPKAKIVDGIPVTESEEEFHAELLRIRLEEEEKWRQLTFSEFNFKASFPRTPVRNTEYIDDDVFGRLKLSLFLGFGDVVGYGAGHMRMPYAVTDPEAKKVLYAETAKEFMSDSDFTVKSTSDLEIKGVKGMKIVGTTDGGSTPFIANVFLIGRDLFFTFVTDVSTIATDEPLSAEEFELLAASFLESFEHLPELLAPLLPVAPEMRSTFANSVFRSEYFRFTMTLPKDWPMLSEDAVQDMRAVTAGIVNRSGDLKVPSARTVRNNLFTFLAKPLGFDKNSSITCTVLKSPGRQATARQLAIEMSTYLRRMGIYSDVAQPVEEKTGGTTFVRVDSQGEMAGTAFTQQIYFTVRNGYGLIFTLSFFDDESKKTLLESFGTLRFEAP
jgi:hypothetical protein